MRRAWKLVNGLDEKGGLKQIIARGIIGVAKSAKDTVSNRQLSVVRWSGRRDGWVHSWPTGRIIDPQRWSTPEDWATGGGYYDMADLLWCNYEPKAGDTVFDIGAGHGGETFFLASLVGEHGRVVSVEAAPGPFRRLEELVKLNGWRQVEPVQVALADRSGTVSITDDEAN